MQTYQSILVANDELAGLDAALSKAAQLEHYSGAEVTLLEVIYDELEKESDEVLPRAEKERLIHAYIAAEKQALTGVANCQQSKVASLNTAVSWSEHREIGICKYALQHHVDLIIKPGSSKRLPLATIRDTSTHRMLAHAACPVLISNLPEWDAKAPVLACLDVSDVQHDALNERIARNGLMLAELLGAPLHLVTVAPAPALLLGRFSSTYDIHAMQEQMTADRTQRLQKLRPSLENASCRIETHVRHGHLVGEIKSLVDELGACILVMGAASREGLQRFFIGNAAESILQHVTIDVLCVRENPMQHTEYGD